jgi:dsDNA-binding SOS-regulon protein
METDPDFSFADSLRVYDESMMGQSTGAQTPEEIEEREALGILIAEQKEVHRIAMLEAQRASLDAILNPAPVTSEEAE